MTNAVLLIDGIVLYAAAMMIKVFWVSIRLPPGTRFRISWLIWRKTEILE